MIAATDPFMGSMGTKATDSPIWGLPLQLGWMLTSGVNYFVLHCPSCLPQQGFMGDGLQVQMQVPEGVLDYCTTYADCLSRYPDAMGKWDAFFQNDHDHVIYQWETGDYVERCHVFSDHKRKRQRDARAALTGSHIRYNHFPFNRHRNDYELLRYREKSIRMNKS
ncbi:hypothetical protein F7725_019428 [Dissostichus mawsoni]|uniref:Uncharacterized protein n=1 Tax=Dissostichus mawsoni TaxID=36200 RepID=A0A7J5YLS9_DISMA|nr:hypothetical protein F7725_019428 [Dissostichus mawsoni]